MGNDKLQMQEVKKVEQEILDVFHCICEKYHLRYSLAWGTLLGAVRHKGFIPWDDDIDVMMPREDYEALIKIWDSTAPADYLLQDYNRDSDYTNNFVKIRKNHTTFIQFEEEKKKKYQKGVFIDVFPMDRVPSGKIAKIAQKAATAVNLLYSRRYTSTDAGIVGTAEKALLKVSESRQIKARAYSEGILKKWNGARELEYLTTGTMGFIGYYYPNDLFDDLVTLEFNGKNYCCTKRYHEFLTIRYGDYMQLPPEEERVWMHHPLVIDLNHNYEELEDISSDEP